MLFTRDQKEKRENFMHHLPTNFLANWKKRFYVTKGMVLLLLKPLDLPPNFVFNLIIYITNPKNNIGYQWKNIDKILIPMMIKPAN